MVDRYNPESEENLKQSLDFAEGNYSGLQLVSVYMKPYNEAFQGVFSKPETEVKDRILKQLWTRAYAWVLTLERLNHARFYQAIHTGNRALLELAVDVLLLVDDKSGEVGEKMLAFAESEKLKAAQNLVDYYVDQGLTVPSTYLEQQRYLALNKVRIQALRDRYWLSPKAQAQGKSGQHPSRWSGNNLAEDVAKVDSIYGKKIVDYFNITLTEYYRTEYRKMNWHIHSGTASTWKMPAESFDISCGFAFKRSADLAFICTAFILSYFGYTQAVDGMRREWENLDDARTLAFLDKVQDK